MKKLLSLGPSKKKGNEEPDDALTPKRESIVYLDTFRDSDTDEERGAASASERSSSVDAHQPLLYRALYDFQGDDDDLCFRAGDVICVTEHGPPESWWCVSIHAGGWSDRGRQGGMRARTPLSASVLVSGSIVALNCGVLSVQQEAIIPNTHTVPTHVAGTGS
jgi:hypothetical protein